MSENKKRSYKANISFSCPLFWKVKSAFALPAESCVAGTQLTDLMNVAVGIIVVIAKAPSH